MGHPPGRRLSQAVKTALGTHAKKDREEAAAIEAGSQPCALRSGAHAADRRFNAPCPP